jgi:hypothetical protein
MNEDLVQKYEKAAYCYANAALRQSLSDSFNAALWSNAAGVYDQADPSKLVITGDYSDEKPNTDDDERKWKAHAVQYESLDGDSSPTATLPQVVALRLEIALFYRTAVAQNAVSRALSSRANYGYYSTQKGRAAAGSAESLICALGYIKNARDCEEVGRKEFQALWSLCAGYMRASVDESDGTKSRWWEKRGNALAKITAQAAALFHAASVLPAAVPPAEMNKVMLQLSQVIERINESSLVSGTAGMGTPDHFFSTTDIEKAIRVIRLTLQGLTLIETAEQKTVKRFLTAADKVNVLQSPAHPHIKQCWLNATEQMRLAIAAVASDEMKSRVFKMLNLHQERLAVGPLTSAASYFACTGRATSEQARELWRRAAQQQLQATMSLVERCTNKGLAEEFDQDEWDSVQTARRLAEAAACCERLVSLDTTATPTALRRLLQAELQLRLVVPDWYGTVPHCHEPDKRTRLRKNCTNLLEWCQARSVDTSMPSPVQRNAVGSGGQGTSASWLENYPPPSAEQRVERAIWLCGVLTHLGHLYVAASESFVDIHAVDRCGSLLSNYFGEVLEGRTIYVCIHKTGHVDTVVDALGKSQRQMARYRCAGVNPVERQAGRDSAQQFLSSASYVVYGISCIDIWKGCRNGKMHFEKGERARQAAEWYAEAAQAAATEQWEAHAAFTKAGECLSEPAIDERGL